MSATHQTGPVSRRHFMGTAAAAALAATASGRAHGQGANANSRLGAGLIGCGGRGGSHLHALDWLKDNGGNVDVVAACDIYRPRLDKVVKNYKIPKGYMDHRELIADPNVDVVFIATPDHHHGYAAIDAVKAGKDVYCEKPVTHWRQFELIKQLAGEVKKSGRVFQLGTQGMSDSAYTQMKELVQDGLIGQPIHAECGYFRVGDWGERGMPIDDPDAKPGPDLNWEAFLGDAPKRPFDVSRFFRWRMYEDYAGGPSTDLFPHSLTPVMDILGVKWPSVAVATGGKFRYQEREIPDTFNMLMDFPEKITVAVLGTQGNNYQGTGYRGAPGRVPVVRGWDGSLTVEGEEIVFIPAEGSKKKEQRFPVKQKEDFVEYVRSFLNCCHEGKTNTLSDVDLAYHTQTALIMGMLALREGKTARFDAEKEQILI